ncbi:hypothetical protein AOLI_G00101080 [Acnodon oligacanthus]
MRSAQAQGLLNQFVGNGPIGICEIQPQHHQVPLVLLGFPDQLCDHVCVHQTPWHLRDPSFLDQGVNIRIPQEVVGQVPDNNTEEYLSLNTDGSELVDGLRLFLLRNPHPFCKPPLLSNLSPPPYDLQDLPELEE